MTVPQPPFRVRAIYSWSGSEEDDLGFIEGDIIEVDSLGDGNWWHGRLKRNKMKGLFPSNYVELIKSDLPNFSASIRNSSSATTSQDRKNQSYASSTDKDSPTDELNFSFQSSKNYYNHPPREYSPNGPYRYETLQSSSQTRLNQVRSQHHQMSHSRSVPDKLEAQPARGSYRSEARLSNNMHHASQPNLSAPPPPQHSIPFIKSKSTFNLRTSDSDPFYPSDPYSSSRNDYGRRHNLSKQATRTNVESKSSSEFIVPYDPQSLTQSRSTISKNSNVFSYSNGSYFSSSQSSYNSSMALSDFSATSAGSFARHKYEESQRQGENLKSSASGNNLVVDEKRVKGSSTGILRKLFSTKEAPPLPKVESLVNVSDISQEEERVSSWIDYKIDLNRANSVSAKERLIREKRVRENEGYIIFEPHKQLSNINNNEVFQTENKLDLSVINLSHVDNYVRSLKTVSSPSVMSPESFITNDLGMKYSSKLEYIRALFILCTEYFEMENASDNDAPKKVDFHQVFRSKKADSYGMASLFQFLASTMGLKTELIVGSLKTPQSIVRHYWNSVLINGEWRLIDASLGNLTNPIYEMILPNPKFHETSNECFYFLAEPLDLIYTHIPDKFEEQHIVPPIDPMVALALPPCFPSFFKNDLKIHKYNNALTKLLDFETFEIDLKVPKDIEINATVLTTKSVTNTLSQIYWKHNQRYCKIKGYLPDNQRFGFINIHSGLKGSQKSLTNIHPLSLVIPITHEGQYKPLDFVSRYPTAPSQQNDLYIKQPQNKNLKYGTDYIFSIVQHPSQALSSVASNSSKLKMALQSPSGRIQKLEKKDLSIPFGSWELHLKCNEIGVWRGLVSVDNGTSLCVFAEWSCS